MSIEIVWPKPRTMSNAEIETLFVETLAKGRFYRHEHITARTPEAMAEALHAIGLIHLQRKQLL